MIHLGRLFVIRNLGKHTLAELGSPHTFIVYRTMNQLYSGLLL